MVPPSRTPITFSEKLAAKAGAVTNRLPVRRQEMRPINIPESEFFFAIFPASDMIPDDGY